MEKRKAPAVKKFLSDVTSALRRLPWKRILAGAGAAAAIFLLAFLGLVWRLTATAPDIDLITVSPVESATYICDQDGNYLRKLTLATSNRDIVSLDEIPDSLQKAVIAIEDERFYKHNGIDLYGILRAFLTGITSGTFSEGASTITQQLIKNSVFTEWTQETSFAERFRRKIQEQYLALQLEKRISKEEILEDYLNTINLGAGCYGVQAAARRYFGKDVSELTVSESAVLAAIPQNPSRYNPISNPEENRGRRAVVLSYMTLQDYLSESERAEALADDVYARIQATDASYKDSSAYSYYEDALIEQAIDALVKEKDYSSEQAYRAVYSGGLRIFSAQDSSLQQICDEEFQNPANFPEGTEFGIDYALSVSDADGQVTHYGAEALRSYVRENIDSSFDLLCTSKDEAQRYADAFREHVLEMASSAEESSLDSGEPQNPADEDSADGQVTDSGNRSDSDGSSNSDGDPDSETAASAVLGERLSLSPQPQASLVLMDQATGFVRAIVGGRGEKTASLTLNRATETTRQPGSTFKILTAYAPAIDAFGQTLATLYKNERYNYENGTPVSNWDITDYSGTVTVREAITRSINVIAVKCITEISPRVGYEYARKLGITTLQESYTSPDGDVSSDIVQPLALGGITQGVTNLELCGAYATIANGGVYHTPKFFTKILNRHGTVLIDWTEETSKESETTENDAAESDADSDADPDADLDVSLNGQRPSASLSQSSDAKKAVASSASKLAAGETQKDGARVLSESAAFLLTDAMKDVVNSPSGTAYGSIKAGMQPVAGKTGTTSNYKDIWFVGYTPFYTCCVWGGYDNNQDLPESSTYHSYSKILWTAVMDRVHEGIATSDFPIPDTVESVTLCRDSHLPAVPGGCMETYVEYFAVGTAPEKKCPLHKPVPETEKKTIYSDLLGKLLEESETGKSKTDKTEDESESDLMNPLTGDSGSILTEPSVGKSGASHTESSTGNANSALIGSLTGDLNSGSTDPSTNVSSPGDGTLTPEQQTTETTFGTAPEAKTAPEAATSDGENNSTVFGQSSDISEQRSIAQSPDTPEQRDTGQSSGTPEQKNTGQPDTSSLEDLMNRLTGSASDGGQGFSLP